MTDPMQQLQQNAGHAAAFLKVLANPDRLLLLCQLHEQERSVGELEALCGIRQPSLSQQLTVLRGAGLVDTRRDGKHIHYRLASAQAQAVMQVLYEQFCGGSGQ